MLRHASLAVLSIALLAGCDMLGIESPEKVAAARDAEGKAVGGACRHAGRAIEDCYTLNRKIDKAAIFAGWRDMNDYMRENKIEPVPPVFVAQAQPPSPKPAEIKAKATKAGDSKTVDADAEAIEKSAAKAPDKNKNASEDKSAGS